MGGVLPAALGLGGRQLVHSTHARLQGSAPSIRCMDLALQAQNPLPTAVSTLSQEVRLYPRLKETEPGILHSHTPQTPAPPTPHLHHSIHPPLAWTAPQSFPTLPLHLRSLPAFGVLTVLKTLTLSRHPYILKPPPTPDGPNSLTSHSSVPWSLWHKTFPDKLRLSDSRELPSHSSIAV